MLEVEPLTQSIPGPQTLIQTAGAAGDNRRKHTYIQTDATGNDAVDAGQKGSRPGAPSSCASPSARSEPGGVPNGYYNTQR